MIRYRTVLKNLPKEKKDKEKLPIDLSELFLPYALPPAVEARLMGRFEQIGFNQKDAFAAELLCEQIAESHRLLPGQILLANSLQEAQQKLFYAFGGRARRSAAPLTMLPFYEKAAFLGECALEKIEFSKGSVAVAEEVVPFAKEKKPSLLLFGMPDLLTGSVYPLKEIEAIAEKLPDTVLLFDETAVEFSQSSVLPLFEKFDNLLSLRTFSNAYGLASLGISYIFASSAMLAEKLRPLFGNGFINAFAASAADTAYQMYYEYEPFWEKIIAERERMVKALTELKGYKVLSSEGNFILVHSPDKSEGEKKLAAAKIAVKTFDMPELRSLWRVSVGTEAQNECFLQALAKRTAV